VRHTLRRAVGGARSGQRAGAVADEDHAAEVLIDEHVDRIGDVRFEVDPRVGEMDPLAEASQRRGMDLVAGGSQEPGDFSPAPAAVH